MDRPGGDADTRAEGSALRIGIVAAEFSPMARIGGLGDVTSALGHELARRGHEVSVLLPGYAGIGPRALSKPTESDITLSADGSGDAHRVRLMHGAVGDVSVTLIRDELIPEQPYGSDDDTSTHVLLGQVAARWLAPRCDLLHLHDHPAAWTVPLLGNAPGRPALLLTLHNLDFQGSCPEQVGTAAGLPDAALALLSHGGRAHPLRAAILGADAITTVSPTYAREICTQAHGHELAGVLSSRKSDLHGLLNGIDTSRWNPSTDPYIRANYDRDDTSGKEACRLALAEDGGLRGGGSRPLVGIISRLTHEKGFDLLRAVLAEITALADVTVLGTGDPEIEGFLERSRGPHMAVHVGWDAAVAHRIGAGSDLLLVPSRFEPCGHTPMIAMAYGTLPVVRRTGGLADTVLDADEHPDRGWGFVFDHATPASMFGALFRGLKAVADSRRASLMQRGMAVDVSWKHAADRYETLMRSMVG